MNDEDFQVFSPSDVTLPYIVLVMELGSDKSGVDDKPSTLARSPKRQFLHPRYFITAHGSSYRTYVVVNEEDTALFERFLNEEDLISEHPRKGEFVKAVLGLKPYWTVDRVDI